jgi:hypothetical protein
MRILEPLLRRVNALRATKRERSLELDLATAIKRLETEQEIHEELVSDLRQRLREAQAVAETAECEKELLSRALERMRVHYEADIAVQARIAATGGLASGDRGMG